MYSFYVRGRYLFQENCSTSETGAYSAIMTHPSRIVQQATVNGSLATLVGFRGIVRVS